MSATRILGLAVAVTLTLGACGNDSESLTAGSADEPESPGPEAVENPTPGPVASNEGGSGPPTRDAELDIEGTHYPVTGSVGIADNGCWYITVNGTARLMVYPAGWTFGDTTTVLRSPEGAFIVSGDVVDGTVRFLFESELPGDGKWADYLSFCQPDLAELAVFTQLDLAYDPTTLTPQDHIAAISAADFAENWPCGRGWATSSTDQRVGIVIHQLDDTQPTPGPLLQLPDPGWNAEVIVGKYLFVDNCNDAIEEWMPMREVIARYPLEGTVTLVDRAPANDDPPTLVRATLSNVSIKVAGESVELTDIELHNDSYNAFAG